MKLTHARIQNFRSIEDTGKFAIDDLTCLVGKNEAGKTAILEALYGQRPYRTFTYDKIRDYPRRFLTKFDERHTDGESVVAQTWWTLDSDDIETVNTVLGDEVLQPQEIVLESGIGFDGTRWSLTIDEAKCIALAIDDIDQTPLRKRKLPGLRPAPLC